MNQDDEHLKLLTVFHYIVAGLVALFGCFPIIHLALGVMMVYAALSGEPEGPPMAFGILFIVIPLFFILLAWAMAVFVFLCGRNLQARRSRLFCQVVAGFECLFVPFGTILGVFTLIVLSRPSVAAKFGD
jgi:hypothetical protein